MDIGARPPARILVIRFSSVGDVVLTSPAIEALATAWPAAEIHFAVKAELADLLRSDPRLRSVIPLEPTEGFFDFAARLRRHRFDAVVDLQGKLRSRLLRGMVRPPRWVTWHRRPLRDNIPVRLGLRPYAAAMQISARYHMAIEELVGRPLPRGRLRYFVGDAAQAEADRVLVAAGVALDGPVVGIAPGAAWTTKRWPIDRFTAVAREAVAAGFQIIVTGDELDRVLGEQIARDVPGVYDLCGRIDLKTLGGVINRTRAFLANDTGPMHIARALGVPTVAIFGSTDPSQFQLDDHRHHFAGVPCAPCHFYGRARCPRGHLRCLTEIDAGAVWRDLRELSQTRAPLVYG